MARLNWNRCRPWRPSEQAFPNDPLARRARVAERSWKPHRPRRSVATPTADAVQLHQRAQPVASLAAARTAEVHCDGSAFPNPGTGGWGAVIRSDAGAIELSGGELRSTNNRMEMQAAISAIEALPTNCSITVNSDSQYLINGASKWVAEWKRKGWRRAGEPIPNADLWQQLDALAVGRTISWLWCRGHAGNTANERADRLAAKGREEVART